MIGQAEHLIPGHIPAFVGSGLWVCFLGLSKASPGQLLIKKNGGCWRKNAGDHVETSKHHMEMSKGKEKAHLVIFVEISRMWN